MANLIIDIGNTQTKLAVFKNNDLITFEHTSLFNLALVNSLIAKYNVEKAILSSVKKVEPALELKDTAIPIIQFSNQAVSFVKNHYKTAHTLGEDRLAAIAGATVSYPDADTLVIDAGTCITYDFIDAGKNYYGGSISPGLQMRYKAVNHYTAALPLLEPDQDFNTDFGNDTNSAITSGVQNGIKYEAEGFIKRYKERYHNLIIILTGGDGIFLHTLLKNSIFAPYIKNDPYLVLKGLNAVIQDYND